MVETKTNIEIDRYKNDNIGFSDFPMFECDNLLRTTERNAFITNEEYVPNYSYKKLDFLIDNSLVADKKSRIFATALEIEAAKNNPDVNADELELYGNYIESCLKQIMLVEAARNLDNATSMSEHEICRRAFCELNEANYGEYDAKTFLGMINTEQNRINDFEPKNSLALDIKERALRLFSNIDTAGEHERTLISQDSMNKLHDYVINRYHEVLDVVPDTDDSVYYDVNQCVNIINQALMVGELANNGWVSIENPDKSNPTTSQAKSAIFLPSNTRRNSSELRRLIIHEQEVHARRSQNARKYNIKPIQLGTAGCSDAEEGLGVMLECAVANDLNNASFNRARDRYLTAGLALGADDCPRDARETYESLWRILAIRGSNDGLIDENDLAVAKDQAYKHVENAFRGTQFWMKGVIYTKLKVYYEGLVKNAKLIDENIDNLDAIFDDIFIGKYDHTDSAEKELVLKVINTKENEFSDGK